jgi:phenylacetate-CoA ligase
MPREELERLQEDRLLEILPFVYERSGLISTVWTEAGVHPRDIRSMADFVERAPFIDKDTLRRYRDDHNDPLSGLGTDPGDTWGTGTTSGTTGDPTVIPYVGRSRGVEEPATYLSAYTRSYWEMGVRPGDTVNVTLFTFRGPVFANAQRIGAVPVLYSHDPGEMARLCQQSLTIKPKAHYVMSSGLMLELERLETEGRFNIAEVLDGCAVVWGGEPMGQRARNALQRWGVDVFDHTAVGDVALAFECRERQGGHFAEDGAFAEYLRLDGSGPADDNERAELVVTSLDPALPLLRFRSDDVVTADRSRCGCGRTHARVRAVGRVSDSFDIEGRTVLPSDVWLAVESVTEASAGLFQIVAPTRELSELRVRVGYEASDRSIDDICAAISDAIIERVEIAPAVELVPLDDLLKLGPPHKIPRVVKK